MRTISNWLVVVAAVLGVASGASAQTRCFVAFVHGHGPNYLGASQQTIENGYWLDSSDGASSFDYWGAGRSTSYYNGAAMGCTTTLIGYDGTQIFWSGNAAGAVADQINTFISNNNIGGQTGDRLVIVAHSMGGLVVRWIMNNGVAGSPYYNYAGHNYANIVNHTSFFITVASPHAGVETADALYGQADTTYGNVVGDVLQLVGAVSADGGTSGMTRSYLQNAGANGGWYGDAYRTRTMYTVAGYTTFDNSGAGESNDSLLAAAWGGICNRAHDINAGFCHEYYAENGDGLVEELSATGRRLIYYSSDPNGGGSGWESDTNTSDVIAGRRVDWLRIEHNHEQSRHDHHSANIRDYIYAQNFAHTDVTCESAVNTGNSCSAVDWCDNNTHCHCTSSCGWPWYSGTCSAHNDTGYGQSCGLTPSQVSANSYPASYIGGFLRSLAG